MHINDLSLSLYQPHPFDFRSSHLKMSIKSFFSQSVLLLFFHFNARRRICMIKKRQRQQRWRHWQQESFQKRINILKNWNDWLKLSMDFLCIELPSIYVCWERSCVHCPCSFCFIAISHLLAHLAIMNQCNALDQCTCGFLPLWFSSSIEWWDSDYRLPLLLQLHFIDKEIAYPSSSIGDRKVTASDKAP